MPIKPKRIKRKEAIDKAIQKLRIAIDKNILHRKYYARVQEHFHSWPYRKSVRVLIDNYEHLQFRLKQEEDLSRKFGKRAESLQTELNNLRLQMHHTPENIETVSKFLGMSVPTSRSN